MNKPWKYEKKTTKNYNVLDVFFSVLFLMCFFAFILCKVTMNVHKCLNAWPFILKFTFEMASPLLIVPRSILLGQAHFHAMNKFNSLVASKWIVLHSKACTKNWFYLAFKMSLFEMNSELNSNKVILNG